MKVQVVGAVALSLTAGASTVDRRSLVLDVCPYYLTMCECYEASLVRDCGWDSQAINGGQCKKGSTFNQYELEEMAPEECDWFIVTDGTTRTQDENCKQWTNACSCKAHEDQGCGWKSAAEFQVPIGSTEYDNTNSLSKDLHSLGQCRWDTNPNTDQYELEDSNSALADLSDAYPFNCEDDGCNQYKTPCDCFNGEPECGWSSSDFRNVDADYILNKEFFQQGRCKSGSTTLGIEVAYYKYGTASTDPTVDECLKNDSGLTDCEQYTDACSCWEQGVITEGARCGWSSAINTCNYLSRFSQEEVEDCPSSADWTEAHFNEFENISQSEMAPAAHVHQADRVWPAESDQCWYQGGNVDAGLKASRCDCFQGFIDAVRGPLGEPLTSCGWTGTKEEGMCQSDAAWDVSDRPNVWAQEAFECLPYEDRRSLCDPYKNITKACECDSWAKQMDTLNYNDVEAIATATGNDYLTYVWDKVNNHINGHLFSDGQMSPEDIKLMTPFLNESCWFDNGVEVSESLHDECMSWQFCGWSSEYISLEFADDTLNACLHGEYTSPEENVAEECEPEPVPEPEPEPEIDHTYYEECNEISDPIVCALYSIDEAEVNSVPFNKGCTWNSGAEFPCQYAQASIMELQEVMFAIQNGFILDRQVKVGGSITLNQYYKQWGQSTTVDVVLGPESWVPHLPTLAYSHPWRPFVETDTCYIISDVMAPVYIPQSYIADSDFDDEGSMYNCVVDTTDLDNPACTAGEASGFAVPYPNVLSLTNPNTSAQYASGLEFLRSIDLKYIDPSLNDNQGPTPGTFCTAGNGCIAERQSVIDLTSATRAPLENPDPAVTYTHAILVDLEGNPMLYDPCVNQAPEFVAAQDLFVSGGYAETGLFGS